MKQKKGRFLLLIGLFSLLFTILGTGQTQGLPVFRIGVLDDARGPLTNGARLAVQEINKGGGVTDANGTQFQLELIVQPTDNGTLLAQAINNLQRSSVIAVVGPKTNEEVLNGMTALQSLNVPVLVAATGDTLIASDTSGRIFRSRAADILQGRALATYLIQDLTIQRIATVQLDIESTGEVVGFATSAAGLGVAPQNSYILDASTSIEQIINNIRASNPQIVVAFGPANSAAELYNGLRAAGWGGQFAYNRAENAAFRDKVNIDEIGGILSASTWTIGATDDISEAFITNYVHTFGEVPNILAAAGYDSVYLIGQAILLPGNLQSTLQQVDNFQGVQGALRPAQLGRGELSDNVVVTQLGPFGGPEVRARFAGSVRLPGDNPAVLIETPTPAPTATPEGVWITIKSARQNVRSGPGLEYDVLGQLQQGETAQVIGANVDFTWVVIEYRGQQGWLATYLLDVSGDQRTVPIITPPPTPTPRPPTATPTPQPIADIVIVSATPARFTVGVPFAISVTVRNQGALDAGPFAVAANFPPDSVFSAVNLPGLSAGQQTVVNLTGTFTSGTTGSFNVVIVADLNNEVDEGIGEDNNDDYNFVYFVDRPILNAGTLTIGPGSVLNLEGVGIDDVTWNGAGTDLVFIAPPPGSGMYIMAGINDINSVTYDMIDPSLATTTSLNVALLPNAYIGIITAEGNRGVIHVDSVVAGGLITLTYRVYSP